LLDYAGGPYAGGITNGNYYAGGITNGSYSPRGSYIPGTMQGTQGYIPSSSVSVGMTV